MNLASIKTLLGNVANPQVNDFAKAVDFIGREGILVLHACAYERVLHAPRCALGKLLEPSERYEDVIAGRVGSISDLEVFTDVFAVKDEKIPELQGVEAIYIDVDNRVTCYLSFAT